MRRLYLNIRHALMGCEWITIDVDRTHRFIHYHYKRCSHLPCGEEKTELEIISKEEEENTFIL